MSLPSNPSDQQIAFIGESIYQFDEANNRWDLYRSDREGRLESKFDSDILAVNTSLSDILAQIDLLVARAEVLTKTNSTVYTPSADYHPATKKYVDDLIANTTQQTDTVYTAITNSTDTRILSTAPITKTFTYYVQAVHEEGYVYSAQIDVLYDSTNIYVSEHTIINTYDSDMINFSVITLGNEITLTATPRTSKRITIKFIRNVLDDFPEIGLSETTDATTISTASLSGLDFINYEIVAQNTSNDDLERAYIIMIYDGTDVYEVGKNIIRSGAKIADYSFNIDNGYVQLNATSPDDNQRLYRVARINTGNIWAETTTTSTSQVSIANENASQYRTQFFTIRVSDTTNNKYQQSQLTVTHDSDNVYITDGGDIWTGVSELATFTADINNDNIRLLATPATSDKMLFQVTRKIIDI